VLPYDWHLPGKEKRRKRKHRKSHGAIGFHDLSGKIVGAWKDVADEVKAYCSQVSAAGMARYKASMREWERRVGQQGSQQTTSTKMEIDKPSTITKMEIDEPSMKESEVMARSVGEKKPEDLSSSKHATTALLQGNAGFQNNERHQIASSPNVPSQVATTAETNEEIEDSIHLNASFNMGNKETIGIWDAQQASSMPSPSLSASAEVVCSPNIRVKTQGGSKYWSMVRSRNESNALQTAAVFPIEPIDVSDSDILDMWHNAQSADDGQCCYDGALPAPTAQTNTATHQHADYEKHTGIQCQSMMQEMQRMKAALEQQKSALDMLGQRVRRRLVVARSA